MTKKLWYDESTEYVAIWNNNTQRDKKIKKKWATCGLARLGLTKACFSPHMLSQENIPYVPKKITTGLSAWITFKVVSESKYNFM